MKRTICLSAVFSLLIVLAGVIGYNEGKGSVEGNSPETGGFSTIVQMNGKELTVGSPTLGSSLGTSTMTTITLVVKNTGHELISLAELELVLRKPDSSEQSEDIYYSSTSVVVKDLSVGQVTTLCWIVSGYDVEGSLSVEVKGLE